MVRRQRERRLNSEFAFFGSFDFSYPFCQKEGLSSSSWTPGDHIQVSKEK